MKTHLFGIDAANQRMRLSLFRITDEDRQLLKELAPMIEKQMPAVVDAFYDHLLKFPEAVSVITNAGSSVDRLKKTNPAYFAELFKAEFGDSYFESRLTIGEIHARIGLTPIWFFGAMTTYIDTIYPILNKGFGFQRSKAVKALSALQKALILDQEMIIEAYIEYGFIEQIRNVTKEVMDVAGNLASQSAELASNADHTGRAAAEVGMVTHQVAEAGTNQAHNATTAAEAMTNIQNSSDDMMLRAEEQRKALDEAQTAVKSVQQEVAHIDREAKMWEQIRERIVAMEELRTTVATTAGHVKEMQNRSNEIGDIVATIDEIAAQTNLLALNAAIEAARAGEQGRGFAVVADEVRKLAEKSSQATKEISDLINKIQRGSQSASEAMDRTLTDVDEVLQVSARSAGVLEAIAGAAAKSTALNDTVTSAMDHAVVVARENGKVLQSVMLEVRSATASIEQIAAVAEENAAASEEMSATTHEASSMVQKLVGGIAEVQNEVDRLNIAATKAGEAASKGSQVKSSEGTRRAA